MTQEPTEQVHDQTNETPGYDGYISPDVAAARDGERVDFSKHLDEDTDKEQ